MRSTPTGPRLASVTRTPARRGATDLPLLALGAATGLVPIVGALAGRDFGPRAVGLATVLLALVVREALHELAGRPRG
jgi:hypothetical protein